MAHSLLIEHIYTQIILERGYIVGAVLGFCQPLDSPNYIDFFLYGVNFQLDVSTLLLSLLLLLGTLSFLTWSAITYSYA